MEAYAEKARAAITRRELAIRDYFDIDAAVQRGLIRHDALDFLALVSRKLNATSDRVNISDERIEALRRQVSANLKPVLRLVDYDNFSLDRVLLLVRDIVTGCPSR